MYDHLDDYTKGYIASENGKVSWWLRLTNAQYRLGAYHHSHHLLRVSDDPRDALRWY